MTLESARLKECFANTKSNYAPGLALEQNRTEIRRSYYVKKPERSKALVQVVLLAVACSRSHVGARYTMRRGRTRSVSHSIERTSMTPTAGKLRMRQSCIRASKGRIVIADFDYLSLLKYGVVVFTQHTANCLNLRDEFHV